MDFIGKIKERAKANKKTIVLAEGEEIRTVQAVSYTHLTDVMDGVFVPNLMLGTEDIKYLRKAASLPLDIHLMIQHPEEKLSWFDIQPGEFVSIHAESTNHLQRALSRIRSYGAHPIVALNPATPLSMIENVIDDIDAVLLMTVNPGRCV